MAITLNHTIVPAQDKQASAAFLARLFDLKVEPMSHFAAVRINDGLTLDYDHRERFESHHYAFEVDPERFEQIFARIKEAGVVYSADPARRMHSQLYQRGASRGFYFEDPNGHVLEVFTAG